MGTLTGAVLDAQAATVDGSIKTRASTLVELIRRDIVTGDLSPGERLRIKVLAKRYDSGPIPVREALLRLSTTGFVVAEDQRGFRVAAISPGELQEILALRLNLELLALRESISKGSMEWAAELVAAHYCLEQLTSPAKENLPAQKNRVTTMPWDTAHDRFHTALLRGCESSLLMQFVAVLTEQMNRYRHLTWRSSISVHRDIGGEHKAILDAALKRDAPTACKLLEKHLVDTVELAIGAMGEENDVRKR